MQQTYSGSFFLFLSISIFADPKEDLRGRRNQSVRQCSVMEFEAYSHMETHV